MTWSIALSLGQVSYQSLKQLGLSGQYIMSVSPPKEEAEAGDQSPENSEHMDRGDPEAQARELAYEFEVKEQDRWLPIANDWSVGTVHHVCIPTKRGGGSWRSVV